MSVLVIHARHTTNGARFEQYLRAMSAEDFFGKIPGLLRTEKRIFGTTRRVVSEERWRLSQDVTKYWRDYRRRWKTYQNLLSDDFPAFQLYLRAAQTARTV